MTNGEPTTSATESAGRLSAVVIGGTGAGKALNLARLGIETRLLPLTGDDSHARLNLTEPYGDRLSTFLDHSAEDPAATGEEVAALADGTDVVFVSLTPYSRRVLPPLAEAGVPVWVDLHDWDGEPSEFHDPFIASGRYLFLSDIQLDNPLRTAEQLLPGKELVVLTHGKRGATAFFPDTEPFFVPAYDAGQVVDTNGAGDAFCAGVAFGRLQGWDWPRALNAGAVVAGGCVTVPELADPALTAEWLEARL